MVKIRDVVHNKNPLQQVVSQETIIWVMHEGRDNGVGASFFNMVISELLSIDVKIDEEDKALILPSSLSQSYDHIITTMLYSK